MPNRSEFRSDPNFCVALALGAAEPDDLREGGGLRLAPGVPVHHEGHAVTHLLHLSFFSRTLPMSPKTEKTTRNLVLGFVFFSEPFDPPKMEKTHLRTLRISPLKWTKTTRNRFSGNESPQNYGANNEESVQWKRARWTEESVFPWSIRSHARTCMPPNTVVVSGGYDVKPKKTNVQDISHKKVGIWSGCHLYTQLGGKPKGTQPIR